MTKKVSFAVVDRSGKTLENTSRVPSREGIVEYKGRNYRLQKIKSKKAKYSIVIDAKVKKVYRYSESSLKEDVAVLDKAGIYSEYLLAMVYTNMNPGTKKFEPLASDLVVIKSGETITWDNLVDKAYADAKPTGLTLREYLISEIKKDSGKWAQTLRAALA